MKKTIGNWLTGGCVYFTLLSILLVIFRFLADPENINTAIPTNFWQIFPCALGFSFAGMILRSKKMARWKRYLLHYTICLLSVLIFFFLLSSAKLQPSSVLLLTVLLSVLYWLVFGLTLLIGGRIRKLLHEDH